MADKRIELMVPVSSSDVTETPMARRDQDLDGKVLGILCNRKHNAGLLLNRLVEQVKARYGISEVVFAEKDAATPAPESALEGLKEKCDLVLNALGD